MIDPISFQGKYISKQTIKKLNKAHIPTEQNVRFVELSTSSVKDEGTLKKINYLWNDSKTNV